MGLGVAASLCVIGALGVVRYLPTHDGPQHVYLAHIENHFSDSMSAYSDYYTPATPITSKGFALLYGPLAAVLPWRSALQVALAIILLTWSWGALAFVNAVAPARRALGLLGFALAFQWSLYMGFFSFLLSTGLGLFTLALAFGAREWSGKRRAAIAALLSLQAICHIFGAAIVGVTVAVLVAYRHPPRRWLREFGILAVMGLPAVLVAARTAGWIQSSAASPNHVHYAPVWRPLLERIEMLATAFAAGPWWRAWPPVVLALLGVALAARRSIRRTASPEDRALVVVSALLVLGAMALPLHVRQWEFMSVRFLPMAVVFGLALLPIEQLPRRGVTLAHTAIAAIVVSSVGWAAWHNRRLERACGPALAGLDYPLERRGARLPIVLDTGCNALSSEKVFTLPDAEPLLNVGALYAVQQGGVVPYAFVDNPQLHSFVFTADGAKRFPPVPDRKMFWGGLVHSDPVRDAPRRHALLTSLARSGARYEDVIFYGAPQDRAQLTARGYETDVERGALWIGRYRGCHLRLEVRLPSREPSPLLVEYGWEPLPEAAESQVIVPKTLTDDGTVVLDLKTAPCGATWLRAGIDKDRSGRWKPADGQCEGADPDGKLRVWRTPEARSERCVLRVP